MLQESPIITGHRGFKAKYTENTINGFNKCYKSGATSIETDLWMTSDEVLIISHDVSTKRIFCDENGEPTDYNILHTDYETLRKLKTIESGEPLLSFKDVLNWFHGFVKDTGSEDHRLMLDIKRLNPTKLLKLLIEDLLSVHNDLTWWLHRIQFGIWDLSFIKYMNQDPYFQKVFQDVSPERNPLGYSQFDILHISVNWRDSLHYLHYNTYIDRLPEDPDFLIRFKITGVSLIYILTWSVGFLTSFAPLLKAQDLKLYSWTVNNFQQFDYLVNVGKVAGLREYGIITDSPDIMVEHAHGRRGLSGLASTTSSDDELVTELSRLTSSSQEAYGGKYNEVYVHLTLEQRVLHFLFVVFQRFAANKTLTVEELKFDSPVDENLIRPVKVNPFFTWVFATCQKFGIF